MAKITLTLPPAWLDDYLGRLGEHPELDGDSVEIVKRTARGIAVRVSQKRKMDMIGDAALYADPSTYNEPGLRGLKASAKAALKRLRAEPTPKLTITRASVVAADGDKEYEVRSDDKLLGVIWKDEGDEDWRGDLSGPDFEGVTFRTLNEAKRYIREKLNTPAAIAEYMEQDDAARGVTYRDVSETQVEDSPPLSFSASPAAEEALGNIAEKVLREAGLWDDQTPDESDTASPSAINPENVADNIRNVPARIENVSHGPDREDYSVIVPGSLFSAMITRGGSYEVLEYGSFPIDANGPEWECVRQAVVNSMGLTMAIHSQHRNEQRRLELVRRMIELESELAKIRQEVETIATEKIVYETILGSPEWANLTLDNRS